MGCRLRALGGDADVRPPAIGDAVCPRDEQDRSSHSLPLLAILGVGHLAHDRRPELDGPLTCHLAALLEAASASFLNMARRMAPPLARRVVGPAPCLRVRRSA